VEDVIIAGSQCKGCRLQRHDFMHHGKAKENLPNLVHMNEYATYH